MRFRYRIGELRRIGVFDAFVFAGGLVNVIVVAILLTYWLLYG